MSRHQCRAELCARIVRLNDELLMRFFKPLLQATNGLNHFAKRAIIASTSFVNQDFNTLAAAGAAVNAASLSIHKILFKLLTGFCLIDYRLHKGAK